MSEKKLSIEYVDIGELKPNSWNTNVVTPENEAKIRESISRFDMFKPLLVRDMGGVKEILGGEHRWQVAKKMGYKQVPIIDLGNVDDKTAKEIGLVDNGRYGEDDGLQLTELLKSLGSVDEITSFLPYSGEELTDLFETVDAIDLNSLTITDEEGDSIPDYSEQAATKPPQTHVMMRFNVPIEDYEAVGSVINQVIRANGYCDNDSLTNAGNALVYLLLRKK